MRISVLALVVFLFFCGGCRTITQESADLISTAAAVGQGDLNGWVEMSDQERYTAHWKLTRACHILDFSVNDHKLPAHFEGKDGKNPPTDSTGVSP
jgi:hypothetical protein